MSPGCFTQRGLKAIGGCSGQRGNVFGVGKYCYVASARRRARRLGAHGEESGGGNLCLHSYNLLLLLIIKSTTLFFQESSSNGRDHWLGLPVYGLLHCHRDVNI